MTGRRTRTAAWCVWLASVLAAASLIKNPLYQVVLLAAVGIVFAAAPRPDDQRHIWAAFLKLGTTFIVISLIYNILISHNGDTILLKLPERLPVLGGNITAEAAIFGIIFGLTFLLGMLAFAAFNLQIRAVELVRLLPGAWRPAATVISVTFSFIPATGAAAAEIQEAQLIRGLDYGKGLVGRVKRAGAVLTPLVVTGLEKAITTAESMESRAYGNPASPAADKERELWSTHDLILAGTALTAAVVVIAASVTGWAPLGYQPYPVLVAPPFNPMMGLALCLYVVPAVWRP